MGVRYSEALVLDTTECFFKFSSVANILGIAFSEVNMSLKRCWLMKWYLPVFVHIP